MKTRISIIIIICSILYSCAPAFSPDDIEVATVATVNEVPITQEPVVAKSPTEVRKLKWLDLPYAPEGGGYQKLDVYLPATGDGPFPTILAIHSGGFQSRTKSQYRLIANHFTALGYAVVSTNYHFTQKASYPVQVEDVFCALAWIHANNEVYEFDPENTFVMGSANGGYLAAMIGTVDSPSIYLENCPHSLPDNDWVQGMVLFYGFYDFTSIDEYSQGTITQIFEPYWGAEYDEISPETLAEMSPLSWVDGSEPPALLIDGTDGSLASWRSERFTTVLKGVGVDAELLIIDAGYGFEMKPLSSPEMQQSLDSIEAFLSAISE